MVTVLWYPLLTDVHTLVITVLLTSDLVYRRRKVSLNALVQLNEHIRRIHLTVALRMSAPSVWWIVDIFF